MSTETTLSGEWQAAAGEDPLGLRCVASPDPSRVDAFTGIIRPLVIGRQAGEGRLVLADGRVSSTHVVVYPDAGGLAFRDSGSKNGTHHNGLRATGGALAEGDVLRVGSSLFVVTRLAAEHVFAEAPEQNLVGVAPRFREACARAVRGAASDVPVLLLGQSGSGKEGLAELVHRASGRRGAFVATNCATLGGDIANATLFGHEKGAFTGAVSAQKGLFRAAQGGTLFLDELGELPLEVQARLLRALEQREVVPVGGTTPVKVDARVVAATNVDLAAAVKGGTFRGDVFARLFAWPIEVPRLSQRREDILRLARHFAGPGFGDVFEAAAAEAALVYDWPFNIRELRQLVARFTIEGGRPLRLADLPIAMRRAFAASEPTTPPTAGPPTETAPVAPAPPPRRSETIDDRPAPKGLRSAPSAALHRTPAPRHHDMRRPDPRLRAARVHALSWATGGPFLLQGEDVPVLRRQAHERARGALGGPRSATRTLPPVGPHAAW